MTDAEKRTIQGLAKNVRTLLSGVKYSIDYYQREYKWETKQVAELIEDLTGRFLEDHDDTNEREAVASYGQYFLGSIVISHKNGQKYIIDGQQRLTTLTLLLIYLHNIQRDRADKVGITEMIFSEKYGKRSFNLDVPERSRCMEALFNLTAYDTTESPESIRNIVGRYQDIDSLFPADIKDETLPYFIDWLIENVHLVEITAYTDEDAYTIFETMNDRGLSLSPTDMLKGYLLANIESEDKRKEALAIWKKRSQDITELGNEETADFFKAWLRSQYAQNIRERKKRAKPQDFDRLGTEFHRWVREHKEDMDLKRSDDFLGFIISDLDFYARQYIRIRTATWTYTPQLEDIFHIAQYGFTLQYPILLAPLNPKDDDETIKRKIRLIAAYIDILLARRLWNWRSISYATMQYAMFLVMREVRSKAPDELVVILTKRLLSLEESFSGNDRFSMHKMNRYMVHRLLARISDTLERGAGQASHYLEYINFSGDPRNPYEVEHIWSYHPEWHTDEFSHPNDFAEYRNRVGDLLLLPKKFNASYNDLPYGMKLDHYFGQNLLAKSLHPKCYEHNPGFINIIENQGLPFKPHPQFKKADLDDRQKLYIQLAEATWNPNRLLYILDHSE